jgi:SNF2 family DNA or RNA helicase
VERIIASREAEVPTMDLNNWDPGHTTKTEVDGKSVSKIEYFTVKWFGLSYSQATEEAATDVNDEMKIAQFKRFNRPPGPPGKPTYTQEFLNARIDHWYTESAIYKNKNQLRDYQIQGVNWLIAGWHRNRNLILADEMVFY